MQLLHIHVYIHSWATSINPPIHFVHTSCVLLAGEEEEEEWPYLCRGVVTTNYGTQNRHGSIPCKTDQIFQGFTGPLTASLPHMYHHPSR
jgi:hypothetical protein